MDVPELSITLPRDYQMLSYKLFKYDVTSASIIGKAKIPKLVIAQILNRSKMIVSLLAFFNDNSYFANSAHVETIYDILWITSEIVSCILWISGWSSAIYT